MSTAKPNILVVYKCLDYPLRKTIDEHLYSFLRYADANCYYLMLDRGKQLARSTKQIPSYLQGVDFDMIIFHYGFMSSRSDQQLFNAACSQIQPLLKSKAIKVIMPQDEYVFSERLVEFVNDHKIDIVFSVSPQIEWPKIYKGVDFSKVRFYKVLTGYLDDHGIAKMKQILDQTNKDIDIGYRARNLPQWLGRHGYMKTLIAEVFNKAIRSTKLVCDISIDPKDTFYGDAWYYFMARCKYMLGVEGGATVLDPRGEIASRSSTYLKAHPACTFEEIESACFPGLDGQLLLIAISPRHLEACATKTCQLLVESTYDGILKPGIHYIEIKKDLSNVTEVLELVKKDELREHIAENAYRDIVESGIYNYRNFVKFVMDVCLSSEHALKTLPKHNSKFWHKYNLLQDRLNWKRYYFWKRIYPKLTNKWTYLIPVIDLAKFIGLKTVLKRLVRPQVI